MQDRAFLRAQWTMLLVLMFVYFFYYCGRQNFGFAIVGIQQTLHLSTIDTGIISAGFLLSYGIGQVINASLGDQYGARKLITLGALLSFLFNLLASFASGFWGLFIPWCLIGYAQSLGFAPGSKMIVEWWEESKRGIAFGLYLSASGIASIIVYVLCFEILKYLDWPWVFRLPVVLLLLSGIIFYLIARDKPEDLGYPAINNVNQVTNDNELSQFNRYKFVFFHSHFQIASIAMGFCSIARYGLIIWLPVYFIQHHINNLGCTIALPIGMAFGAIASGSISDQLFNADRIKPTILFMLLASVFSFLLFLMPIQNISLMIILLFFLGFFVFGPQTSLFTLCPEMLGTAYASTGVGIMNAYGYAFSSLGEVLIGYLIYVVNHVSIIYCVVSFVSLMSALMMLFILKDNQSASSLD